MSPRVPRWCRLLRGTPKVPTALHDWVKVVTAPLSCDSPRQREGNLRGPPPLQEPPGQRSLCVNQTEVNSPTSPMTAGIARPARDIGLQLDPQPCTGVWIQRTEGGRWGGRASGLMLVRSPSHTGVGKEGFKPVRTLRNHISRG